MVVGWQLTFRGRGLTIVRRRRCGRWGELGAGPGPAAIICREVGAISAHGDAADAIGEPQVEQRLLCLGREMRAGPVLSSIDRVENGLVVPHGPAVLAVGEEHGG